MNNDWGFGEFNTIELKVRKIGDEDDFYLTYDYAIDGDSLCDELGADMMWKMGVLPAELHRYEDDKEYQQHKIQKLNRHLDGFLGKSKPDFQDEYHTLFECHCCHSAECDGFVVKIKFFDNVVVWENIYCVHKTYDENNNPKFTMSNVLYGFEFDRTQYEKAFNELYIKSL